MSDQSSITFRGVTVRFVDLRFDEEAGAFTRIHLSTDFSAPVIEAMGWNAIPDSISSAKLAGELQACNALCLVPNAPELSQYTTQMECSTVSDFQIHRVKEDSGIKAAQLRFIVRSRATEAAMLMERYIRAIGSGVGSLKVTYAEQQSLPLTDGKMAAAGDDSEDDEEITDERNILDIVPVEDEPITDHLRGPALISHQTRTRGARPRPGGIQ